MGDEYEKWTKLHEEWEKKWDTARFDAFWTWHDSVYEGRRRGGIVEPEPDFDCQRQEVTDLHGNKCVKVVCHGHEARAHIIPCPDSQPQPGTDGVRARGWVSLKDPRRLIALEVADDIVYVETTTDSCEIHVSELPRDRIKLADLSRALVSQVELPTDRIGDLGDAFWTTLSPRPSGSKGAAKR